MHEHTIASKIIADAQQYGNVVGITIEVGDLAHLPADEMLAVMQDKTDWNVSVVRKPAVIACQCGFVGAPKILEHMHDHAIFECPSCGASLPKILEGHDIILKDVEIEEDEN